MFSNRLRTVPEGASAVHGALALSNGKTRVSRPAEFPHGEKNWSRSLLRATTQCSKPVDDKSGPGGLCPGRFPGSLIYVLFVGPSRRLSHRTVRVRDNIVARGGAFHTLGDFVRVSHRGYGGNLPGPVSAVAGFRCAGETLPEHKKACSVGLKGDFASAIPFLA